MTINTNQHSVQNLFEKHATFQVPKYQREYAWDESAIDDFIQDISKCLLSRKTGGKRSHFFGGVVTTKVDIPPSSRQNFEVIDGQQRLASFTMLVAAVIQCAERRVSELSKKAALSNAEKKAKKYFEDTVKDLKSKYLLYRDSINLEYVDVSRLKLSNADDAYFQDLINEKNPEAKRDSHKRIFEAWTRLNNFVESEVIASGDPLEQAQCMGLLVSGVLAEDCTIIFMWSDERTEAFQIFQVLNDRGVNLTDGDLLRAKTMELLDTKAHKKIQEAVSLLWDEILSYPPKDIDDYLRWYFSSVEETRPNSANLEDQFLKERFKCHDK
ncbi:MAG: DUF262 domain-containing protein, partial [Nanoarchaeota archaeon]|nr:DUF262 domain-containing protein [Nanoarchaeota archaeon]